MPGRSIIAADGRLCVGEEVRRPGWSRVLLVSDEFYEAGGRVEEMEGLLEKARISVSVYSDVNCEPDTYLSFISTHSNGKRNNHGAAFHETTFDVCGFVFTIIHQHQRRSAQQ